MDAQKTVAAELRPLYWMALGTFAVGTEGFMIAGMLPKIASSVGVNVATAGQLVTVFAFAYALSSPVLTALTGSLNRRKLLIGAMGAFALANLAAVFASGFWALMAARVLLAFTAGLYVPGANALAGVVVAPERRGRAIAIINGGLTVAIALGVPLGTLVANTFDWRATFGGVAVMSAVATFGLIFGLDRKLGANLPVASLSERIRVARRPAVLQTLLVTLLWATGAYTLYTYITPFLESVTTLRGAGIGWVLFSWGASAAVGVAFGGKVVDRFGPARVIVPALTLGMLAFLSLSVTAHVISPQWALLTVLPAVVLWGVMHWAFYPAQQVRLIGIAGTATAPVALSLNASFMYMGFSIGAAAGSLTLSLAKAADLGWVAAMFEFASLAFMLLISRPKSAAVSNQCPASGAA